MVLTWVAISMIRQGRSAPTASTARGAGRATDDEEPADPELAEADPVAPVAVTASVEPVVAADPPAADPPSPPRPSPTPWPATATTSTGSDSAMFASIGAGIVSALLGVGGGIIKVPVMNVAMGVPLKVATATSNMMIGITATSSAVIYLLRGEIDPYIAGPTALGVFVGASIGSRVAGRIDVRILRWLFVVVVLYTAFEMARRALGMA